MARTARFFVPIGNCARAAERKLGIRKGCSGEGGAHGAIFVYEKLYKGSGASIAQDATENRKESMAFFVTSGS